MNSLNGKKSSFTLHSFRGMVALPPLTPSFNFDDYPAGMDFGAKFEFAEVLCSIVLEDRSAIIVHNNYSVGGAYSNAVAYRNSSIWIKCPYKNVAIGLMISASGSNDKGGPEIRLCKSRNADDLISINPIWPIPDSGLPYIRFSAVGDELAWINVPCLGPDGHIKACDFLPFP